MHTRICPQLVYNPTLTEDVPSCYPSLRLHSYPMLFTDSCCFLSPLFLLLRMIVVIGQSRRLFHRLPPFYLSSFRPSFIVVVQETPFPRVRYVVCIFVAPAYTRALTILHASVRGDKSWLGRISVDYENEDSDVGYIHSVQADAGLLRGEHTMIPD